MLSFGGHGQCHKFTLSTNSFILVNLTDENIELCRKSAYLIRIQVGNGIPLYFFKLGFKVASILIIEIVLYKNIKYFWWLCLVVIITQLLLHSDPEPRLLGISS